MNIKTVAITISLMMNSIAASGVEFSSKFQFLQSPACDEVIIIDVRASVCEFDQTLIAKNRCNEESAPIHKGFFLGSCASIAHPFVSTAQKTENTNLLATRLTMGLLVAIRGVRFPGPPNLAPWGTFMSKDPACIKASEILRSRVAKPPFIASMDKDSPAWRDCMTKFAYSVQQELPSHPYVIAIHKFESFLNTVDIDNPNHVARIEKFIVDMEQERIRPSPERAFELLGKNWSEKEATP